MNKQNTEMVSYTVGTITTQFETLPGDTVERYEGEVVAILVGGKDAVEPIDYYTNHLK